jgi:hypothetical protein
MFPIRPARGHKGIAMQAGRGLAGLVPARKRKQQGQLLGTRKAKDLLISGEQILGTRLSAADGIIPVTVHTSLIDQQMRAPDPNDLERLLQ